MARRRKKKVFSKGKLFLKHFFYFFLTTLSILLVVLYFFLRHYPLGLRDERVFDSYRIPLGPVLSRTSPLPTVPVSDDVYEEPSLPTKAVQPDPDEPGYLPLVPEDADGKTPLWKKNAMSAPDVPKDHVRVAIVIDDIGMNRKRTEMFIALPKEITLAFLTYAPYLKKHLPAARQKGHEVILHVPMENIIQSPLTGPSALKISMTDNQIRSTLEKHLSLSDEIVGINNHTGSLFTADEKGMRAVMSVLKKHDLLFLDSLTSSKSKGRTAAYEAGVPFIRRHIFLDNVQEEEAILGQLQRLENVARKRGYGVAIGHPYPQTHAALLKWIPTLKEKKIVLVPLTALPLENVDPD